MIIDNGKNKTQNFLYVEFLKHNLPYSPAILCTGAALAFKTGRQVNMPSWVDYIYMGWLLRCISNPKVFIPRYFSGFKLLSMILIVILC